MHITNYVKKHLLRWTTVFLLAVVCAACMQSYTGQVFSYPPGSKPHESKTWTYFGELFMTKQSSGSEFQLSKRHVKIGVWNKEKNKLLSDEMTFKSGHIGAMIDWEHFEKLQITLFEEGYSSADSDKYSNELMKEPGGKRQIADLTYIYDKDRNAFIRQR